MAISFINYAVIELETGIAQSGIGGMDQSDIDWFCRVYENWVNFEIVMVQKLYFDFGVFSSEFCEKV